MRVTLEGYAHLARMIDKCRALLAGTEGEYIYPCPMDDRLLAFTGLTAEQFTAAVRSNQTEEGFMQWFRHNAKPHIQADLEEWNRSMLSRGPTTPEKQASFNRYRDAVDPSRTDLTTWCDLQDLEEGRTVPRRA